MKMTYFEFAMVLRGYRCYLRDEEIPRYILFYKGYDPNEIIN